MVGRFPSPQAAIANPCQPGKNYERGCVIDLVTGRQIWRDGKWCDRQKPVGIHSLPAFQKNEAQPTAEALNQPVTVNGKTEMSSYFDKFDRETRVLAESYLGNDEGFLKALMGLEAGMIKTCELFAGDIDTPDDIRQAIIGCIAVHAIRYEGGDFMGDSTGKCEATSYAVVSKRSKLSAEMHSLWHEIARRRLQPRYGLVMDNPEYAVRARDRWVEENVR